jgi:protease IV
MQPNQPETENVEPVVQPKADKTSDYEAIVQRLAFAAINEQRRSRRWRIFFLILTFLYLTPVLLLTLDIGDMNIFSSKHSSSGKHTALVKMTGVIADDSEASAANIITGLRKAFDDKNTAGVVLEINSPGGSPVQSAYIYDEIKRLREKHADIPLYVVVTDMAASGGYFVASAADKIYVNKSSLVGSIGVRMDSFGLVELIKKLGIERRLLTSGEHKGLLDPFLPQNDVEKEYLQTMLDQVHQHFIDAVKQGRGDRLKPSPELFSGLVWSGEAAIKLGLVDDYGNTDQVAREVITQEDIVDYSSKELLLDRLANRVGASFGQSIQQSILTHLSIR